MGKNRLFYDFRCFLVRNKKLDTQVKNRKKLLEFKRNYDSAKSIVSKNSIRREKDFTHTKASAMR